MSDRKTGCKACHFGYCDSSKQTEMANPDYELLKIKIISVKIVTFSGQNALLERKRDVYFAVYSNWLPRLRKSCPALNIKSTSMA